MRFLRTVADRCCGYAMNMFLLLYSTTAENQSRISPMSPHTGSGGFSAGLNTQTKVAYRPFDTQTLGFLSRRLPSLSELKRRSILSILQWNGRTIQDLGIVSSLIALARYNDVWELGAQRSCNGARSVGGPKRGDHGKSWHLVLWHERYQMKFSAVYLPKIDGFSDARLGWRALG
jgi:hypothetical protein